MKEAEHSPPARRDYAVEILGARLSSCGRYGFTLLFFALARREWPLYVEMRHAWIAHEASVAYAAVLRVESQAWHDVAWHGMAWHGMAWHGVAWRGMAAPCLEPHDVAHRNIVLVCRSQEAAPDEGHVTPRLELLFPHELREVIPVYKMLRPEQRAALARRLEHA